MDTETQIFFQNLNWFLLGKPSQIHSWAGNFRDASGKTNNLREIFAAYAVGDFTVAWCCDEPDPHNDFAQRIEITRAEWNTFLEQFEKDLALVWGKILQHDPLDIPAESMHFLQVEAKLRGWNRIVADIVLVLEGVSIEQSELDKVTLDTLIDCLHKLANRGLYYLVSELPIAKLVVLPMVLNNYPATTNDELSIASAAMNSFEVIVRSAVITRKIIVITRDGLESCIWFLYRVGIEERFDRTGEWSVYSVAKIAGLIDEKSGFYRDVITDVQLLGLGLFDTVALWTLERRKK